MVIPIPKHLAAAKQSLLKTVPHSPFLVLTGGQAFFLCVTGKDGQHQFTVGIYWGDVQKEGFNPITKQPVTTTRRELQINYELPLGEEYARMVTAFVE